MQRHRLSQCASLVFALVLSAAAHADGMVRLNLGYRSDDAKVGGTDTKSTDQTFDVAGGYLMQSRFLILGQYAMSTITAGSSTFKRTSYGPGIGWVTSREVGLYVDAIYYFSSEYSGSGVTYKGTGYQGDLGLRVQVSSVFICAGISYANFTYTKTASGSLNPSNSESIVEPRLGLQFEW